MKVYYKQVQLNPTTATDYNDLLNKPEINGVELVGDQDTEQIKVTWFGTQDEFDALGTYSPTTFYIIDDGVPVGEQQDYLDLANKPSINGQVLTGNKLSSDLSMYTAEQIDNMLASLRSIKVVAALPAAPLANTMYYVGPDSEGIYMVYLFDSVLNRIDLGPSVQKLYTPGKAIQVDNATNVIDVKYDDDTIKLNTSNELYADINHSKINGLKTNIPVDEAAIQRFTNTLSPIGAIDIPDNADLNTLTYLRIGNYLSGGDASTKTLSNCPTEFAFRLQVISARDTAIDDEGTATWRYRVRIITDRQANVWRQECYVGSTVGSWYYGPWKRILDSSLMSSLPETFVYNGSWKGDWTSWKGNTYDVVARLANQPSGVGLCSNAGNVIRVKTTQSCIFSTSQDIRYLGVSNVTSNQVFVKILNGFNYGSTAFTPGESQMAYVSSDNRCYLDLAWSGSANIQSYTIIAEWVHVPNGNQWQGTVDVLMNGVKSCMTMQIICNATPSGKTPTVYLLNHAAPAYILNTMDIYRI